MGSGSRNSTLLGWISLMNVWERITYNQGQSWQLCHPLPSPAPLQHTALQGHPGRGCTLSLACSGLLAGPTVCYSICLLTWQSYSAALKGFSLWPTRQHCSSLLVGIRYWGFENGLYWIWRGFKVPEPGREVYPCMHCNDHSQSQALWRWEKGPDFKTLVAVRPRCLNSSRVVLYTNVEVGSLEVLMWGHWRIRGNGGQVKAEENHLPQKIFTMDKIPYSWTRCLGGCDARSRMFREW